MTDIPPTSSGLQTCTEGSTDLNSLDVEERDEKTLNKTRNGYKETYSYKLEYVGSLMKSDQNDVVAKARPLASK